MSHLQVGRNNVSIDSSIIFLLLFVLTYPPLFTCFMIDYSFFLKMWANMLIYIGFVKLDQKSNESCVLQPIIVKYQILTEETEVNKEKKIQT